MLRVACDLWPDEVRVDAADLASMHLLVTTDGGHGDATIRVLVRGTAGETYHCRAQTAMALWQRLREGWEIPKRMHWIGAIGLPVRDEMFSIYSRYKEIPCDRPSTPPRLSVASR